MGKSIKKLLVPNKAPIGTSFKLDEIVINPIDGKAYIKKTDNTVIELGAGGTSTSTFSLSGSGVLSSSNQIESEISGAVGGGTSFTLTADGGSNQTISNGNTLDIAGGTNITTAVGSTDTVTVNLDSRITLTDITASAVGKNSNNYLRLDDDRAFTNNTTFASANGVDILLDSNNNDGEGSFQILHGSIDPSTANLVFKVDQGGNITRAGHISASGNITASGNISASGDIRARTGSFEHISSDRLISRTGDADTGFQFASDTVLIEAANIVLGRFATNRITLGSDLDNSVQITGSLRLTGSAATSERTPLVIDSNGVVAIGNVDYITATDVSNNLQVPSDGTYDDGLLPFTASDASSTTISDAIDDINEVLAGLAPPPAPDLDDINGSFSGVTANLSFGVTNTITDYSNVLSNTLSNPSSNFSITALNQAYAATTNNNDVKIGVVDARSSQNNSSLHTTIVGTLNDDISADAGTFTNHGAKAFGNGEKGVLALFVNNNTTPIHPQSLSGSGDAIVSSLNPDGSGFKDISATQSAHFVGSGNELTVFKHRSGSFVIQSGSQRRGWNYARVEHQLENSTPLQTNYIEWVNEVNDDNLAVSSENITDFTGAGLKYLSGVKYFTSFTATYKAKITNVYKNVYSDDNSAIDYGNDNTTVVTFDSHIATGSKIFHQGANTVSVDDTTPTRSLPSLNSGKTNCEDSDLQLTASLKSRTNVACTTDGTAFTIDLNKIKHPIKTDITDGGSEAVTDVLLDNRTETSTLQKETFISESVGRIPSASYNTQTSATNAIGTFNSANSIASTTDLLVAPSDGDDKDITGNGVLVYPNNIKGGNYAGLTNGPSSNVNYSSVSGDKNYYRIFKNESGGSLAQVQIKIKGSATLVTRGNEDDSTNDISCRIKYPDSTGYLDLGAAQADGANLAVDNTPSNNGSPTTAIISDGTTNILNLASSHPSFAGNTIANNEHIVVNLRTGEGFTGRITEIEITNF